MGGANTSPVFFTPKNIALDTELKRGKQEKKIYFRSDYSVVKIQQNENPMFSGTQNRGVIDFALLRLPCY